MLLIDHSREGGSCIYTWHSEANIRMATSSYSVEEKKLTKIAIGISRFIWAINQYIGWQVIFAVPHQYYPGPCLYAGSVGHHLSDPRWHWGSVLLLLLLLLPLLPYRTAFIVIGYVIYYITNFYNITSNLTS